MKKTVFYLIILLSLSYVTSCAPPAQQTDISVKHADSFYNINHDDYPLLHLPLINPIEAKRQDGRTPWRVLLLNGPWVHVPDRQDNFFYGYAIEELEKFAVSNGVIMAYSAYIDKDADAYVLENYYHWFVIIPEKEISEGFHTEDEFNQYIQSLGITDPEWLTPDDAYEKYIKRGGCLDWIPDCE